LQPEQIIPGVADYYATSVLMVLILQTYLLKLVKVVLSKLTIILSQARFSANARIHASILSLYDNLRLKQPKIGWDSTWTSVDAKIKSSIADAKVKGDK
jgi:molybdopterin-containing oxidoreductase family iron-sulfur binding subunit